MSAFLTLSILFAGCGAQDDKVKEDNKEEVKQDKKDEKSKSDKAKEKIAQNKKSEKSTEEVEQPATQETESSELQTTEQATAQQPTTEQQVQNDQLTDQERIDFCKDIRGGIPEACLTPVIRQAGDEKVAIERKASYDLEAGVITKEQYDQKMREATEIMNQAWLKEFGVNPGA